MSNQSFNESFASLKLKSEVSYRKDISMQNCNKKRKSMFNQLTPFKQQLQLTKNLNSIIRKDSTVQINDFQLDNTKEYNQVQEQKRHALISNKSEVQFLNKDLILLNLSDLKNETRDYIQKNIKSLDFDIFEVEKDSKKSLCNVIMEQIFSEQDYYSILKIDKQTCMNFAQKIGESYFENPYHDHKHACDVAQFTYFILTSGDAINRLQIQAEDQITMIVASFIHDLEHPGFTNAFLTSVRSQLAIRYNDKSPLENHHIAQAFQILTNDTFNIFKNYSQKQFQTVRENMIHFVLATDNFYHNQNLEAFQKMINHENFSLTDLNHNERLLIYEQIIHTADINNMSRPLHISKQWSIRVIEEFWIQGDTERQYNVNISYLMDRTTTNMAQSQVGFCKFFVNKQFSTLQQVLPNLKLCLNNMDLIIAYWEKQIENLDPAKVEGNIEKIKAIIF